MAPRAGDRAVGERRPDRIADLKKFYEDCLSDLPRPFSDCLGEIHRFALQLLGQVHHICTNEYIKRGGVVLWTDHGLRHTLRVLRNCRQLLPLLGKPDPYRKFLLYGSALLHDVGMFVRLVEGDAEMQRRYHGRLAELALGNYMSATKRTRLKDADAWYLGLLARLHQSHEFRGFKESFKKLTGPPRPFEKTPSKPRRLLSTDELLALGGILLFADGLDVHHDRAEDQLFQAFSRVIGPVNPKSSAEWLVNSLVSAHPPVVSGRKVIASYCLDLGRAETALELDVAPSVREKVTAQYVISFLWRYLYDNHFADLANSFSKASLRVTVLTDAASKDPGKPPRTLATRVGRVDRRAAVSEWRFWYEGLSYLSLDAEARAALTQAWRVLLFDTCFVMVKDDLRGVLRILVPADLRELYGGYVSQLAGRPSRDPDTASSDRECSLRRFEEDCLKVKVPDKYSVAGQVWYRRLPEFVAFRSGKGGRMMAAETDEALGLNGLFYYPHTSPEKNGETLRFLLVFNHRSAIDPSQAARLREYCVAAWRPGADRGELETRILGKDARRALRRACNLLAGRLGLATPKKEKA